MITFLALDTKEDKSKEVHAFCCRLIWLQPFSPSLLSFLFSVWPVNAI